jgi:hypothetical protein
MRAIAPPGQAGQVVGLNHLLWCLAMLTGTLLAGWLVTVDEALPFWLAAALNLPTVFAARGVHRFLTGKA